MTNESGEFTAEQLAKMDSLDVVALLRRNSGDPNFYWRVREAVLNRAADEIKRLLESEAKAERIAVHWQAEAQRLQSEPKANDPHELDRTCIHFFLDPTCQECNRVAEAITRRTSENRGESL